MIPWPFLTQFIQEFGFNNVVLAWIIDVDIGPQAFKTYQRNKGMKAQLQPSLWMDGYFLITNCEDGEDPPLDRELVKIQLLDHDGHDIGLLKSPHWVYGNQGAGLHNVVKAPPLGRCKEVKMAMALQVSEGGTI